MSEPVAWALIWLAVGFVVGFIVAWLRGSLRQHRTNIDLAGLIRSVTRAGETHLLLKFADRLEGKEPKP